MAATFEQHSRSCCKVLVDMPEMEGSSQSDHSVAKLVGSCGKDFPRSGAEKARPPDPSFGLTVAKHQSMRDRHAHPAILLVAWLFVDNSMVREPRSASAAPDYAAQQRRTCISSYFFQVVKLAQPPQPPHIATAQVSNCPPSRQIVCRTEMDRAVTAVKRLILARLIVVLSRRCPSNWTIATLSSPSRMQTGPAENISDDQL